MALGAEDDEVSVDEDQAVTAGRPRTPDPLAGRRVDAGQHLATESVEVTVMQHGLRVLVAQRFGGEDLLHGEHVVDAGDLHHDRAAA